MALAPLLSFFSLFLGLSLLSSPLLASSSSSSLSYFVLFGEILEIATRLSTAQHSTAKMPIRVKLKKPPPVREGSPFSARFDYIEPPYIGPDDSFRLVVKKLGQYITEAIELPSSFEQLRTTSAGTSLRLLVDHLADTCVNPAIVNALL